jgi:hypothetical protein
MNSDAGFPADQPRRPTTLVASVVAIDRNRLPIGPAIDDPSETVAPSMANWPFLRLAPWRMTGVAWGTRDPGRRSNRKLDEKSSGDG